MLLANSHTSNLNKQIVNIFTYIKVLFYLTDRRLRTVQLYYIVIQKVTLDSVQGKLQMRYHKKCHFFKRAEIFFKRLYSYIFEALLQNSSWCTQVRSCLPLKASSEAQKKELETMLFQKNPRFTIFFLTMFRYVWLLQQPTLDNNLNKSSVLMWKCT